MPGHGTQLLLIRVDSCRLVERERERERERDSERDDGGERSRSTVHVSRIAAYHLFANNFRNT